MKKLIALATLLTSLSSFAVLIPGYERPLFQLSDLEVVSAQHIQTIESANLVLNKQDGAKDYTALTLSMKIEGQEELSVVTIPVESINEECGSVTYTAEVVAKQGMGARTYLSFTDHTNRICEDFRKYLYNIHFTRGFGWCGTMDQRVIFGSNNDLEALFSIM